MFGKKNQKKKEVQKRKKNENISKNVKEKNYRYGLLAFLTYLVGIILLANLFKIQVIDGKDYREKATSRLVKEVKVESVRGNIMDRTGTVYAKTDLTYNVYIYKGKKSNEELNEMGKIVIDILNKNEEKYLNYLPITKDLIKFTEKSEKVLENWKKKHNIPEKAGPLEAFNVLKIKYEINEKDNNIAYNILVFRELMESGEKKEVYGNIISENVKRSTAISLEEHSDKIKGLYVITNSNRTYLRGSEAAHIIGYTSRINKKEYEEKKNKGYKNDDIIGKTGIEKTFEGLLKGETGIKQIEVGVEGNVLGEYTVKEAKAGSNIVLTIDSKIQAVTENALREVVEKMKNGGFRKSI